MLRAALFSLQLNTLRVNCHDCPVEKKTMYAPFPAIMGLGKECETQPLWTAVTTLHNNLQMEWIGRWVGWRGNSWLFKGITYGNNLPDAEAVPHEKQA